MFPVKRIPTLISENTMRYLKTTYLENGQKSDEQNIYIPYVFRNSSLNEVKPEFSETYKTPQNDFVRKLSDLELTWASWKLFSIESLIWWKEQYCFLEFAPGRQWIRSMTLSNRKENIWQSRFPKAWIWDYPDRIPRKNERPGWRVEW